MGALRAIERPELAEPHPARDAAGPAPQLDWIEIRRLVVDDDYQRPISPAGAKNIRTIAERFNWSRFSPVIVAPVEGGLYAIIDGQHRTTAAALIGIESVPCQVVLATKGEQAQAFTAINGAVTRMTGLALHRASVAAGDEFAGRIEAVTSAAGVKVCGYAKGARDQAPGETLAIGALGDSIRLYGDSSVVLALRGIVETGNNLPGTLLAPIIMAAADVVHAWRGAGAGEAEILGFFEGVALMKELGRSRTVERERGVALWTVLADRLRQLWARRHPIGGSIPAVAAPSERAGEKAPAPVSVSASEPAPSRKPSHPPGEYVKPAPAPRPAVAFSKDWSAADEARCHELLGGGWTITAIAALMRKPYALVTASGERWRGKVAS